MSILVVGDANADLSAKIESWPAEGGDALVHELEWYGGGSATNVATMLGRLGAPVRLLARVGHDPAAGVALRMARAAGVDLSLIQTDATRATGVCFAAVSNDGARTFFSFRGANMALEAPPPAHITDVEWVHLSAYALLEGTQRRSAHALIAIAAARGIPISLDMCLPTLRARRAELLELLPQLSILFANELELAELYPDLDQAAALAQLLGAGLKLAAIKQGARGALLASPQERHYAPAIAVPAIDTTGCGDAFVAGFLAAHLRAASAERCGALANALGALTATRRGAADALPELQELRRFLQEQPDHANLVELLFPGA